MFLDFITWDYWKCYDILVNIIFPCSHMNKNSMKGYDNPLSL